MLNASVGVQRVIGRLRRPPSPRVSNAMTVAVNFVVAVHPQRRFRAVVAVFSLAPRRDRTARGGASVPPVRQARISLISRVGHERTVALVAAAILLSASVVSVSASRAAPATGGTTGPGTDVRIVVGGGVGTDNGGTITEADPPPDVLSQSQIAVIDDTVPAPSWTDAPGPWPDAQAQPAAAAGDTSVVGPFLDDGTLLKPVAVDTTVPDGSGLVQTYKVKPGDTLTGIATKFGISMMNHLVGEQPEVRTTCTSARC